MPSDTGEITTLAVERAHRRHGHGRELLDAARRESVRRGWRVLVLWVVTGNDGARAFYARAGFAPDGHERTDERLGFPAHVVRYRSATAP
jgi:ribosomal protein S18 acetylase RimI-like enzyme